MYCFKRGSYNSMFAILGMSSVVGAPIVSIYPTYGGGTVRQDLHRIVEPRISLRSKYILLWQTVLYSLLQSRGMKLNFNKQTVSLGQAIFNLISRPWKRWVSQVFITFSKMFTFLHRSSQLDLVVSYYCCYYWMHIQRNSNSTVFTLGLALNLVYFNNHSLAIPETLGC